MSLNRSRMTRRDVLRLMGMSAAGTALAACVPAAPGGGGAAAPSSSGAAAGEAATETTVRFWNVWGAAREELMNQIAAGFAILFQVLAEMSHQIAVATVKAVAVVLHRLQ